ncbi:hypothetical protein LDG_5051 [Legionella drancourtii LLAP12]|uniref:Uncharacterized protein n=1 Tax=Legionella drancourtii LLAP12 TaxID=658187 RepID=G9EIP5_9GAMM|nr:hypothetical protein LDG_5051 [Legionella drancourtii LLAP12]
MGSSSQSAGRFHQSSKIKHSNKKATHLINAYSSRLATVLGSTVPPDKSNEIKGIPRIYPPIASIGRT